VEVAAAGTTETETTGGGGLVYVVGDRLPAVGRAEILEDSIHERQEQSGVSWCGPVA